MPRRDNVVTGPCDDKKCTRPFGHEGDHWNSVRGSYSESVPDPKRPDAPSFARSFRDETSKLFTFGRSDTEIIAAIEDLIDSKVAAHDAQVEARTRLAMLREFDAAAKTVNLHDGPRPGGKSEDYLKGQTIGIEQGLKIARSILESQAHPSGQEGT